MEQDHEADLGEILQNHFKAAQAKVMEKMLTMSITDIIHILVQLLIHSQIYLLSINEKSTLNCPNECFGSVLF